MKCSLPGGPCRTACGQYSRYVQVLPTALRLTARVIQHVAQVLLPDFRSLSAV
jgi:hypothetical protein